MPLKKIIEAETVSFGVITSSTVVGIKHTHSAAHPIISYVESVYDLAQSTGGSRKNTYTTGIISTRGAIRIKLTFKSTIVNKLTRQKIKIGFKIFPSVG